MEDEYIEGWELLHSDDAGNTIDGYGRIVNEDGTEPHGDDAPIGKIRVQCIRCSEWIVCDWDDAFGFEDDQPFYMCGTCQRLRHFDHAA